jgi:DNA-binding LytR/AlgR family response regulator
MNGGTNNIADYIGFSRRLWLGYAASLVLAAAMGASSFWIEDTRNGMAQPAWCYAVTEGTSVVLLFVLTPALLWLTARLDPKRIGWPRAVFGHLAGFALGSAAHIAGMAALRYVIFPLFGRDYHFGTPGNLGLQLVYEVRKDAAIYLGMVALIWLVAMVRRRAQVVVQQVVVQRMASAGPRRLEIRDGAQRVFVDPAEILWAEAAGNYVELHLAGRSLLQRQTLSALEQELSDQDFARIHRSRLVNRRHVRSIAGNDSGDFTVTLDDGRQIAGGRRWRDALK